MFTQHIAFAVTQKMQYIIGQIGSVTATPPITPVQWTATVQIVHRQEALLVLMKRQQVKMQPVQKTALKPTNVQTKTVKTATQTLSP